MQSVPLIQDDSEVLQEFGRPAAEPLSEARAEDSDDALSQRDTSPQHTSLHQRRTKPTNATSAPPAAPAATTPANNQLRASVQQLQAQLQASLRGRQLAESALKEVQEHSEHVESSLQARYEALLQEKDFQLAALRSKLAAAEPHSPRGRLLAATRRSRSTLSSSQQGHPTAAGAAGDWTAPAAAAAGGGAVSPGAQQPQQVVGVLSEEDLHQLRKEMEQQELLLRGYQQENEAAMLRIKELEGALASTQAASIAEVARLERQWALLQQEGASKGEAAAARLHRILDLEAALQATTDEAAEREAELRGALERLKWEKADAEARAQGLDLARMREEDALVSQVQAQMRAMQQQHAAAVEELQAKLKWYVENQQLLTANDALVAQQQEVIRALEGRLAAAEGPQGRRHRERVAELEQQVEQLQRSLSHRHPNSLPAVLAAAKPTPAESALVAQLTADKEAAEGRLVRQQQEHEHALRALQQQYEQLKAQLEQRLQEMKAPARTKGRVAELERQLEEQRTIHQRRVRALEARLALAQRKGAAGANNNSTSSNTPGASGRAAGGSGALGSASKPFSRQGSAALGDTVTGRVTPSDEASRGDRPSRQGSGTESALVAEAAAAVAAMTAAAAAEQQAGGGGVWGQEVQQQQVVVQKLAEEVAGLKSLLQERSQQYTQLQARYYALETQHRTLLKEQQQQQGAAADQKGPKAAANGRKQQSAAAAGRQGGQQASLRKRGTPGATAGVTPGDPVGDTPSPAEVGAAGDSATNSWEDWEGVTHLSDTASDTGDEGDVDWQQRCKSLRAANRQLRRQLLQLTRADLALPPPTVAAAGGGGGVDMPLAAAAAAGSLYELPAGVSGQQGLITALQSQLAAAQAAAAAAQAAAAEAQQQRVLALEVVEEGHSSWRRQVEAAVAEEQERWQQRVRQLEQHLDEVSCEASSLRQLLHRAQEGWTPATQDFVALERKLAALQADAQDKEASWRAVLADKQELAAAQAALIKKRCEVALAAKDAEIEGFRVQLSALLAAARSLHLQQVTGPAGQQRQHGGQLISHLVG